MRRAIREFLERKLQALEEMRVEGRDENDLSGKILFGPAPKTPRISADPSPAG